MKKIKRLFQIVLSTVLAFSFAFTMVACSKEKDAENSSVNDNGMLDGGYTEGVATFLQNGRSEYSIMIPAGDNEEVSFAKEELVYFMEMATGVKIPTVTDENYDKNGKYISIGRTKLYNESGLSAPQEKYGASGYIVKSKGDNVFLTGSDSGYVRDYGAIYATYHFLKGAIGLEVYAVDCFDYERKTSIKMPKFNVECVPDADRVLFNYLRNDATYMLRMRNQNPFVDSYFRFEGHSQTGIARLVPEATLHPEWFVGTGSEWETICYTRFDTTAYANTVVDLIQKNPGKPIMNLGITDNTTTCKCTKCTQTMSEKNTNQSGLQIMFLNAVIEKVYDVITETEGVPLRFSTFAYHDVLEPPVHLENGKFVPDCPEVIPNENLYIWWAPVNINQAYSLQSKQNEGYRNQYLGWGALTDKVDYYGYNYMNKSFSMAGPSLVTFGDNIEFFKNSGTKISFFYEEGPLGGGSFSELMVYVQSKMAWDNSLKYDTLAYDFIERYYGPAAKEMREYYDLVKSWYAGNQSLFSGTWENNAWKPETFPLNIVNLWLNVLDKAEAAVLAAELPSEVKTQYLDRVHTEILTTSATKIATHDTLPASERESIRERIRPWFESVRFINKDYESFDAWYNAVVS